MSNNWLKRKNTIVFVDNSALRAQGYNLESKQMKSLEEIVDSGDIEIVTTSILAGEFKKHLSLMVREEIAAIKKLKASHLYGFKKHEIERSLENINVNDKWNEFCEVYQTNEISYDVDWKIVFSKFFQNSTPFNRDNKKNEFPDAFNIELIDQIEKGKNLAVISQDEDFDGWKNESEGKFLFKSIEKFVGSYFNCIENVFKDEMIAIFEKSNKRIEESIVDLIKNEEEYQTHSFDSEVQEVNVHNIIIDDSDLISFDKEEGVSSFYMTYIGQLDLEIYSEVNYRDPIDKDVRLLGGNVNTIRTPFIVEVVLDLHEDETWNIVERNFSYKEIEIDPNWEDEVLEH